MSHKISENWKEERHCRDISEGGTMIPYKSPGSVHWWRGLTKEYFFLIWEKGLCYLTLCVYVYLSNMRYKQRNWEE